MTDKSKYMASDFQKLIPEYSDEEIINILKKRKHYLPEAANMAIKEAISRGIILSEQDLFDPKFKENEIKKKFFPSIENKNIRKRIIKSIARSFVILGILPLVWGFIIVNTGNKFEGGISALGGLFWIYCSAMLLKTYQNIWIKYLLVLLVVSVFYITKIFITTPELKFMDLFIVTVLYGFVLYGIIFLWRLKYKL